MYSGNYYNDIEYKLSIHYIDDVGKTLYAFPAWMKWETCALWAPWKPFKWKFASTDIYNGRKSTYGVLPTCTNKQSERGSNLDKRKSELFESITTNHFYPALDFLRIFSLYRLVLCIINISHTILYSLYSMRIFKL